MKPATISTICGVLSRKRLLRLADDLYVNVDRRAAAAELGDAIAGATTAREIVERLTAPEWLALCSALHVSKHGADRGRQAGSRANVLQLDAKTTPKEEGGRGRRPKGTKAPDNKGSTGAEASKLRAATDTHVSPLIHPTPSTDEVLAATLTELEALRRENVELRAERADAIEIAEAPRETIERRRRRARARLFVVPALPPKPITRADCVNGPRPCPWTACEFHLAEIQRPTTAAGQPRKHKRGVPEDLPPPRPRDTCVLDVTDRGEQTLEQVADALGVTRERVRQIQASAQSKALTQAGRIDPRFRSELRDFLTADSGINTAHIRVEQQ